MNSRLKIDRKINMEDHMKVFHKYYIGFISALKILGARVCNLGKIRSSWINSIRGIFKVEIIGDGNIEIGKFLMSRGPLYIKSVNNGKLNIGQKVFLNHNCSITCAEYISIGNNCMFANNLVIVDHDHAIGKDGVIGTLVSQPIVIEDQVWCGANVTITKGVHIGKGAVIAANAVVVSDVEAHTIVAGVPAKRIK